MSWLVLSDRLSPDAKLPGVQPRPAGAASATAAPAQNTTYLVRFIVPRPLEIDRMHFRVQTVDAADPAVDLGVYKTTEGSTTITRVASTGALTGVVTTNGRKELNLTAPILLEPLVVHYAAFVTASAGVLVINNYNLTNAGASEIVADGVPNKSHMTAAIAPPLPATIANPSSNTSFVPMLFLRERGT